MYMWFILKDENTILSIPKSIIDIDDVTFSSENLPKH